MAKDPTISDVSTPEGGTYPSSEEVRDAFAESELTRSEIINQFGDVIGNELLEAGISSLSGLMVIDDTVMEPLSPEAKDLVMAYLTLQEIEGDQNDNPVVEEVPADAGGGEEEADVETEAEEEAEGGEPEEESVSEGDGDEDADTGEGAPEEAVAEGEAADETDTTGDVEEPVEEVAGERGVVEEGLDEHEHEVPSPMTYNEAKEKLEEISFVDLREMAEADGIKPQRSKKAIVVQLLSVWFPAPPTPVDDDPPMSARVRRIKESQQQ